MTSQGTGSTTEPAEEPIEERHLRQASLVDPERLNRHPVAIVGVGAIGSHLAEMLVKLGVLRLLLIDPDEVDTVNLGVQGFHEVDVGASKVDAMRSRFKAIDHQAIVEAVRERYDPCLVPDGAMVFACVDSIGVRRRILRDFRGRNWPVLFDGRMAAESLQIYCVTRSPEAMQSYEASLFAGHEAHQEACTARSTIYCATMAAAILCSQLKRFVMDQPIEPRIQMDLITFDCFF